MDEPSPATATAHRRTAESTASSAGSKEPQRRATFTRLSAFPHRKLRASEDFLSFTALARDFRNSRYSFNVRSAEGSVRPPPAVSIGQSDADSWRAVSLRAIGRLGPCVATAEFFSTLRDQRSIDDDATGLTLEVNKKIRQSLLKQHPLTNRFTGTPLSQRAEAEYHAFVSHYQLKKVQRRLIVFAIMLVLATLYDALISKRSAAFVVLRTGLPVTMLLSGALLLHFDPCRLWWRLIVMSICVFGYVSILSADAVIPVEDWSPCDKDYNTLWQLMWLLLVMQCSSLFFALDLLHVAVVLLLQWSTFVLFGSLLYGRWWEDSGQGQWRWPEGILVSKPSLDKVKSHLEPEGEEMKSSQLTLMDDSGSVKMSWEELEDRVKGDTSSRFVVDCFLIATGALLLLLLAVRRMNRFERQCFVNTFVLLNKVSTQVRQIRGQHIELLALFSNPRVSPNSPIQLRPLQLGQELKHLLRAVPHVHIAVEPAAGLADVQAAVKSHDPRIILFSGHSFMGSLAFELPNGRIDLPPPDLFIKQLEKQYAPRLQCVFLNGCATAELAYKLVTQLPYLYVICWCSITEDAAARSFAQGFYDAVGTYIAGGEAVQVTIAYWAGLSRMYAEGFRLGDPSLYLHPRGHPHLFEPNFQTCDGCCPPVHGVVLLLSNRGGQVHALMPDYAEKPPPEPRGHHTRNHSRSGTFTESFFSGLRNLSTTNSIRQSRRHSRPSSAADGPLTHRSKGEDRVRSTLAEAVAEQLLNLSTSTTSAIPSSWMPVTEKDLGQGGMLARKFAGDARCRLSPTGSSFSSAFMKVSSKQLRSPPACLCPILRSGTIPGAVAGATPIPSNHASSPLRLTAVDRNSNASSAPSVSAGPASATTASATPTPTPTQMPMRRRCGRGCARRRGRRRGCRP